MELYRWKHNQCTKEYFCTVFFQAFVQVFWEWFENISTQKTTKNFIDEKSKLKNSNQVFNDLTYESLQFAKENGITNPSVEGIFRLFNINNVYLTILISIMGLTLITLKDYPNIVTALFLIYLITYIKVLNKTKGEKWRLILTGLIFTLYGTITESVIIGKTGILNYISSVKPTVSGVNFPLFLPLVYFQTDELTLLFLEQEFLEIL